jgi:hypothetical protein
VERAESAKEHESVHANDAGNSVPRQRDFVTPVATAQDLRVDARQAALVAALVVGAAVVPRARRKRHLAPSVEALSVNVDEVVVLLSSPGASEAAAMFPGGSFTQWAPGPLCDCPALRELTGVCHGLPPDA